MYRAGKCGIKIDVLLQPEAQQSRFQSALKRIDYSFYGIKSSRRGYVKRAEEICCYMNE